MLLKYNRLTGLKTEETTEFKMICPHCGADANKDASKITVEIIGKSIRPDIIDNSDLPKELQRKFNMLPTKRQSILGHQTDTEKVFRRIKCNECNHDILLNDMKINTRALRQWCDKICPFVMDTKLEQTKIDMKKNKGC